MLTTRRAPEMGLFAHYSLLGFDEMFDEACEPRPHYALLHERLSRCQVHDIEHRHRVADMMMRQQGITFTVYGERAGRRADLAVRPVPRIIPADEWDRIERGLEQRIRR